MGWGFRHMYYLTGLPGWVRFGYSPGWGALPPGAYYLLYGQWPTPQMQAWWDAYQSGQLAWPGAGMPYAYGYPPASAEDELKWLKNQQEVLSKELERIQQRIEELSRKTDEK